MLRLRSQPQSPGSKQAQFPATHFNGVARASQYWSGSGSCLLADQVATAFPPCLDQSRRCEGYSRDQSLLWEPIVDLITEYKSKPGWLFIVFLPLWVLWALSLHMGLRVLESQDGWSDTEKRAFETSTDPQWGLFAQNFPLSVKLVIL